MVLTWSSAFVLLHLIRKGDVRKETSGKRCWRIYNNHCRSSNMFSCKSSMSDDFRPGSWSKQPSCRAVRFPNTGYLEGAGGAQRTCPVHRQLCQTVFLCWRCWEVWRISREDQFHVCGTVWKRFGLPDSRGWPALTCSYPTKITKMGRSPSR